MISISVKTNIDQVIRNLQAQHKQVAFAAAKALTQTARQAAKDVETALPTQLDRPTPFTLKSIGWRMATKATLTSVVYIKPTAAAYLVPLIEGGRVRPKRRALLDPTGVQLNQYGNLPAGAIKRLLARKDVFSGVVRGVPGIWQRQKRGGVRLLVRYQGEQQKRPQFKFADLVQASVAKNFDRFFNQALDDAMRTAR